MKILKPARSRALPVCWRGEAEGQPHLHGARARGPARPERPAPPLPDGGRAGAAYYEERTNVVLNHLLYEGLDIDSAMHDAYAWALIRSEHAFRLYTPAEELAISATDPPPHARGQRAQLGRICGACGARGQSQRVVLHSGRFGLHLCGDVHLPWHLLYRADPDAARGM